MSAESPRMVRSGGTEGALTVPATPPPDRSLINTVSGFISDVKLTSNPPQDPKDVIQWARFETIDINEPLPEGEQDLDLSPIILVLGYGQGVQVWSVTPNGNAKEVLSWRQGVVKVLRLLQTPLGTDFFAHKRPLIALCDSSSPGNQFCSLSFISLRNGDQVKSIKFKNPILDVLSNKRSVVVTFSERFAVFDAGTLEDRMTVTTCYPCPCPLGGSNPINPLALGDRWLAYADKKLIPSKRSSGGCESDGVPSYTASVLHAAKSFSKGLRGLSESVAYSLAGTKTALSQSPSPPTGEFHQPGVVTILDIENPSEEDLQECEEPYDPIVAHFIAHSDAIIAMKFDASGMLLVTADKRGHDFHVFRIHPHPFSSTLAAVHHLYALHRGDTTAKVQDIAISLDSRWVSVSTLRGTTHLFPINPYGGATNTRTHTHPRVVNRLSRFQRSAGLPLDRPHSPVCDGLGNGWFPNPRLPPYPAPIQTPALAHLRATQIPTNTITRTSSGRQRLSSTSEDSGVLLARASWAPNCQGASVRCAVYSLYVLGAGGQLTHYRVQPKSSSGVSREKICEDTVIEVDCEATCAWSVCSRPTRDLPPPLANDSPLLARRGYSYPYDASLTEEERWLSQVEIVTHAGPHRRLWMGPQFVFKTYNTNMGSAQSLLEEVDLQPARTPPVSVPARPHPLLLDSGSTSSLEHSPCEGYRKKSIEAAGRGLFNDVQLKEDLAEAMKETEGRMRSRRVSDLIVCASNTDEDSFRCVRCAPADPPAPLPSARSLSPTSRQLPASQAPIAPSPPPAAAALSATLRLPAALIADETKRFKATLPSFHDPDSKFKIPLALLPSTWPQLEVPDHDSKSHQNECSDQKGMVDNLTAEACVNVNLNSTENNCLNLKEHFDVIDLRNESNDFYEKPSIDLIQNMIQDDPLEEDVEIENILNVTLSLRPKESTPLQEAAIESQPLLIEEHFENNELNICKEVECLKQEPKVEIQKVKTKRSRKSKVKQTENKLKTNEPRLELENQIRNQEETFVDMNTEFILAQTVHMQHDIEAEVVKDDPKSISNKFGEKNDTFEIEECIQPNTESNPADCLSGKKSVENMHKVKSWGNFTKQYSPAPEIKMKSRTVSPPVRTWSAIASGTSRDQQEIEEFNLDDVEILIESELKDSKRNLDEDNAARQEWPKIEKKKKEKIKKNNVVENFKIKIDTVQANQYPEAIENEEISDELWNNKDIMKSSVEQLETATIHISEQLIKMVSETSEHEVTEIEKNEANRFKRKKGKSKPKKNEAPLENSSDSDVGVIGEGMFLPVQENLINEEIVSLTAKLEEIYNMKDVLVAQCVDPLEIIIQNDTVDDKSDDIMNEDNKGSFVANFVNEDLDDSDFFAEIIEESSKSIPSALSEEDDVHASETLVNEVVLEKVNLVPVTVSQVVNLMEKSSDDDITSPIISSQTDSDEKEEKKTNEVIITVPPPKPVTNKKKSKKKRR